MFQELFNEELSGDDIEMNGEKSPVNKKKTRWHRCGECEGCSAENCGHCAHCTNKALRKVCKFRKCANVGKQTHSGHLVAEIDIWLLN